MLLTARGFRARREIRRAIQNAIAARHLHFDPLEPRTLFSFGLTTTTNLYTVDVGANLVFSVSRTTASSAAVGDLTSTTYNGTQLEADHSVTSRYSHYESGLSSSAVVTATVDPAGNWIVISCDDTGATGVGVIQYYIAEKGVNDIFMATYAPGPDSPSPGEMRFITYTNHTVLTNAPDPSDNNGSQGNIESTDVFGFADGTTSSKYYGEYEAINTQTYGLSGVGFGEYMNIGNRETSSGGPFFKDIDYQTTSPQSTELYTYTFSGHSQTENFRPGLHGPYALEFTNGPMPPAPNYSFIDALPLTGLVPASGRGTLTGTASGVPSGHQVTVALSNAADQYWGTPAASGAYTITGVLPGTYTETLYQDELAVGTRSVTIAAGATTAANIVDTYYVPPEIFNIGSFDGTPVGFLNSANFPNMHPSDIRMSPWADAHGLTNYTIGVSTAASWPMAEWKEVTTDPTKPIDVDNRITFTLTAAQAAVANTLRIALTRTGAGGRPIISVNGGSYSSAPASSTQPTARGVTLGNWRGNNVLYTYNISTSALHSGTNTIDIGVASGSSDTDPWLGPWYIYDAIDLVTTASITNAPVVTSVSISPAGLNSAADAQANFTATAKDQFGNVTPANFNWSVNSGTTTGTIDNTGLFIASAAAGTFSITATNANGAASAIISGLTISPSSNVAPTIATPAAATPNPTTSLTTNVSVLGADDAGEANLTYFWTTTAFPAGASPASFSLNGTNASKNAVATFSQAGSYTLLATARDAGGFIATSSIAVTVNQTFSSIVVTPASAGLHQNTSQQFTATAEDQFGDPLAAQPTFTWSMVSGPGSIAATSGLYSETTTLGTAIVKAASGAVSSTAGITITNGTPTIATAASANPNPATALTTNLSVLGADDLGESNLTYSWTATTVPSGAGLPTYSINGTNAAKNTTATFSEAGSYTFLVTIKDASNLTNTSSITMTVNQTLSSIVVTPSSVNLALNATQQFTATGKDQFGAVLTTQPAFTWSVTTGSGMVSASGLYTAPASAGTATIKAAVGAISGSAFVTIANTAPTVATAASASPNPVTAAMTGLSVLGADDAGESNLTYTWVPTNIPMGATAPNFSINGTNAAKNTTATFSMAGAYTFLVTIKDSGGLSVTSSVNVTVNQTVSSFVVSPLSVNLPLNATQQFTATALDQFNFPLAPQPTFSWSVSSGSGSISATGFYTAGGAPDSAIVKAAALGGFINASVTIANTSPTLASAASATPNPAAGATTNLSVLGADDGGEANLTYSWTAISIPVGATAPTYSANGTNAAKNAIATFFQPGPYTFQVTIKDSGNLSITSNVNVTVNQTPVSITISPTTVTLHNGDTQPFTAAVFDQFNTAMSAPVTWSLDAGSTGSINSMGLFTAPASGPGSAVIRATAGTATNSVPESTLLSVIAGPVAIGGDIIRLVHDASAPNQLNVFINNTTNTPTYTANIPAINQLTLTDPNGSATYIFDFSNGIPLPTNPATLTGIGTGNTLKLIGPITTIGAFNISPASFSRGSGVVNFSGIQTMELSTGIFNPTGDLAGLNVTVDNAATLNIPYSQHLGALTLNSGAVATVPVIGGSFPHPFTQLAALVINPGSMLNLNNNDLLVSNTAVTSLYDAIVAGQLFSGAANASNGLNALGSLDGVTYRMFHPDFQFDSITVQPGDALVKYTYRGDAYLQGTVGASDYSALDSSFLLGATPAWAHGDYNNDGAVDYRDYQAIDYGFTHQGAPLANLAPALVTTPVTSLVMSLVTFVMPAVLPAETLPSQSETAPASNAATPSATSANPTSSSADISSFFPFSIPPVTPQNWWLSALTENSNPTDTLTGATFPQI